MPMEPTTTERLVRIREVADRGLRYYATAYLNTSPAEEHTIPERELLMAYMVHVANVVALLENDDLSDRGMMDARHLIVDRYVEAARDDPWMAPAPPEGP